MLSQYLDSFIAIGSFYLDFGQYRAQLQYFFKVTSGKTTFLLNKLPILLDPLP